MTTRGATALQRSGSEVLCSPDTRALARGHTLPFFSVVVKNLDEKVPEASSSHSHTQPTWHFSHATKHCATAASQAEGSAQLETQRWEIHQHSNNPAILHEGEGQAFPPEACFLHN